MPGGGVEQGRQDEKEDQIGIEGDLGNAGDKTKPESGDDEHNGVGGIELAGNQGKDNDEGEEQEDEQLRFMNAGGRYKSDHVFHA